MNWNSMPHYLSLPCLFFISQGKCKTTIVQAPYLAKNRNRIEKIVSRLDFVKQPHFEEPSVLDSDDSPFVPGAAFDQPIAADSSFNSLGLLNCFTDQI